MTLSNTEITMVRGERKVFVGVVRDDAGNVVDITGTSIYFTVRENYPSGTIPDDSDDEVLFDKTVGNGITLSDPTNGEFEILITKLDTNSVEVEGGKGYVYGISIVESGQSEPKELALGNFVLLSDVVRNI